MALRYLMLLLTSALCSESSPMAYVLPEFSRTCSVGTFDAISRAFEYPCENVVVEADTTVTFSSGLKLGNGQVVAISGASRVSTLSGGGNSSLFYVSGSAALTITSLTLTQGLSSFEGGLISVYAATLILDSVTLSDSTAEWGGALYVENGTIVTKRCAFSSDSATHGGAIYAYYSSVSTESSEFTSNVAEQDGGVMTAYHSTVASAHCDFQANTAAVGGAVFLYRGAFQAQTCSFSSCAGTVDGGAVAVRKSTMVATECEFLNNIGGQVGGAVLVMSGTLQVEDSTFDLNSASVIGGAVALIQSSTLIAAATTFKLNQAPRTTSHSADIFRSGGDVYCSSSCPSGGSCAAALCYPNCTCFSCNCLASPLKSRRGAVPKAAILYASIGAVTAAAVFLVALYRYRRKNSLGNSASESVYELLEYELAPENAVDVRDLAIPTLVLSCRRSDIGSTIMPEHITIPLWSRHLASISNFTPPAGACLNDIQFYGPSDVDAFTESVVRALSDDSAPRSQQHCALMKLRIDFSAPLSVTFKILPRVVTTDGFSVALVGEVIDERMVSLLANIAAPTRNGEPSSSSSHQDLEPDHDAHLDSVSVGISAVSTDADAALNAPYLVRAAAGAQSLVSSSLTGTVSSGSPHLPQFVEGSVRSELSFILGETQEAIAEFENGGSSLGNEPHQQNSNQACYTGSQTTVSSHNESSEFSAKDSDGFLKSAYLARRVIEEKAATRYTILRQLELVRRRRAEPHSEPNPAGAKFTQTMTLMCSLPDVLQNHVLDF